MQKLSLFLTLFLLLAACKKKQVFAEQIKSEDFEFNYQKMPKKLDLKPEAMLLVEDWVEFKKFVSGFDALYKAKNNEDLILAIDDLIEQEKLLAASAYPEILDDFQIKSRQSVVKTYFLKVKASILNNQNTTESTMELLNAYNAYRKQFNIVVNSQLDEKLILDEE